MYNQFFGFKEKPFKLVPNPDYLFLSKSHEEALAHLTYAISQGDGFAEIIGEVGTGKTTICRAFLENLDENTEAAYIINPKMDSTQLLKAVNDEFGISSKGSNTKALIDRLNSFLMGRRAVGKRAILIIDEAQNLDQEVLEQLRLLSNLETTKEKLLQIILVGQPELGDMLDSYELRQLGQRITLSCHIFPLTYEETKDYIQHRIRIASQKPAVKFTRPAFRFIYRFSGGIPRLINIACDRMLLIAFGHNEHKIAGKIAERAVRELAGRGAIGRSRSRMWDMIGLAFILLCITVTILLLYRPEILNRNVEAPIWGERKIRQTPIEKPEIKTSTKTPVTSKPTEAEEASLEKTKREAKPLMHLENYLEGMNRQYSRRLALKSAIQLWVSNATIDQSLAALEDDYAFFRLASKQNGLLVRRIEGDLRAIKNLNLPAILEFHHPGGRFPVYLTLIKMSDRRITFKNDLDVIETEQGEAENYWKGVAYIPWKDFLNLKGEIPGRTTEDSITTLKILLKDIGFSDIDVNSGYDERTREIIKQIQDKHGLKVDGLVGGLTKIVLYNEKKSFSIPHIAD